MTREKSSESFFREDNKIHRWKDGKQYFIRDQLLLVLVCPSCDQAMLGVTTLYIMYTVLANNCFK